MKLTINAAGRVHDVSGLVSSCRIYSALSEQAGSLDAEFAACDSVDAFDAGAVFVNGGVVRLYDDEDNGVFLGYIFAVRIAGSGNKGKKITVRAYDSLRYFNCKDSGTYYEMTCSDIFTQICKLAGVPYKVLNGSLYKLPPHTTSDKSRYRVIADAIEMTENNSGKKFMIRDNFGTVEMCLTGTLDSGFFIGDSVNLLEYRYEKNIDADTYNRVKIVKKDCEFVTDNTDKQREWGVLQYYERGDKESNAAQLQALAKSILKERCKEQIKLNVRCLGDFKVFAGACVTVGIDELKDELRGQLRGEFKGVVTECEHEISENTHFMELELLI